MNLCKYIKNEGLSLDFYQKLSLRGLLLLGFLFFSLPVFANPYFPVLSGMVTSARNRDVVETTNDWGWTCCNNLGTITNATFCWWGRVENQWRNRAGIQVYATTEAVGSHGEDVLAGSLGWDDSWLALTGETNITTSLAIGAAYCLVGTSENSCDIDYGGITNTVAGDFDIMLINEDNNLRINTTGNFRMGMVLADTNKCITQCYVNTSASANLSASANGASESWEFKTVTMQGLEMTITTTSTDGSNAVYTTTLSEPFSFAKGSEFKMGYANIAGSFPYTNMFFDTRCYSRILSDEEINAIKFDGLCELENRGRINYALISDGVDDYIELADYDSTQSISVFATIKPADIANLSIAGKFDYGLNKRSWWFRTTEGLLQISISDDGTSSATHNKSYKGSIDVADGDYHQVGFSYTNNVLKLYVDGIEDTSITKITDATLSGIYDSTVVVTVGSVLNSGVSAFFYNGSIGDLCVQAIATNQVVVCDGANLKPVKAGSKRFSQRNPAPSNCFYDEVTDTYFENDGTGEFGIERNDN